MKKIVYHQSLGKMIILSILLIFAFYFFLASSFKTSLNCKNGFCNLKTSYLFGEVTNKDMPLDENIFYCLERRHMEYSKVNNYEKKKDYLLMLQTEKVFKYTDKTSCTNELNNIKTSLYQNDTYSKVYEDFFINVLYKIIGVIILFLMFIIIISKISPVHIELKTGSQNRKLP